MGLGEHLRRARAAAFVVCSRRTLAGKRLDAPAFLSAAPFGSIDVASVTVSRVGSTFWAAGAADPVLSPDPSLSSVCSRRHHVELLRVRLSVREPGP